MRPALALLGLMVAIFFAFALQEFIPPIGGLFGPRVLLVPLIFCYGALALPGWAALILAVYTGLLTDLMYLNVVDGRVEIALGWSIVYFVFFGILAQGFQPGFLRGHWWIHLLLSALGTSALLALQFAMISVRREVFFFNEAVFWRIVGPGLIAAVLAPFFDLAAMGLGALVPQDFAPRRGFGVRG